MANYYVYISTETEKGCPKFNNLDDAIKKFKETPMKTFRDNVFLGYEESPTICFDVIHKFFNDNILINDYLNHEGLEDMVKEIEEKLIIRYQWTPDILGGALIDWCTAFAPCNSKEMKIKWNEVYLFTLKNNTLMGIGWVKPTRETFDNYGWNYPKTASYVSMMNVTVVDDNGYPHEVDMDPRAYLQMLGKKFS